jgi:hypothetical protein
VNEALGAHVAKQGFEKKLVKNIGSAVFSFDIAADFRRFRNGAEYEVVRSGWQQPPA